MAIRTYDHERDWAALWSMKQAFERELGSGTGADAKQARYEGKLTDEYRERYRDWVGRCLDDEPGCIQLAVTDSAATDGTATDGTATDGTATDGTATDSAATDGTATGRSAAAEVVGYVFVLPETHAMIWDAGVLNELYLAPAHRGEGLADDLLAAAIDVVTGQSLPMDRLVLDVDPDNSRARAFYECHGFEPWGELVVRRLA